MNPFRWYTVSVLLVGVMVVGGLFWINKRVAAIHAPELVQVQVPAEKPIVMPKPVTAPPVLQAKPQVAPPVRKAEAVVAVPVPTVHMPQARYYAGTPGSSRVYSNTSLRPAPTIRPRAVLASYGSDPLVVDLPERTGRDLDIREVVARFAKEPSMRCAVFSFQPKPGKTVNRVICSPL